MTLKEAETVKRMSETPIDAMMRAAKVRRIDQDRQEHQADVQENPGNPDDGAPSQENQDLFVDNMVVDNLATQEDNQQPNSLDLFSQEVLQEFG